MKRRKLRTPESRWLTLALPSLTLALGSLPSCLPAQTASATAVAPSATTAADTAKAEALLEKGDYQGAEAPLKALVAASPKDARLQFDLGFAEERTGNDAAAADAYAAASAADAQMVEPRLALGLLEARRGRPAEARPPLEAVAALSTASPELRARALRALARLDESRNPSQAVDDLLRATQLTGEQPGDAELSASLARRDGKASDAEAAYRRALAQDPTNIEALTGLASILQSQGKLVEADSVLRPAYTASPTDPRLTAQLANLDAAEGKLPDAISLLTALRAQDPTAAADPALTQMLAHLLLLSGDATAAEPLYEHLAARSPQNPQLLDDFGSVLVREQHYAQAQAVLARAVAQRTAFHDDSAWGEAAGHLAFAASRNHDPKGALQALAARATVLPNSPASLFLAAISHDALHQNKEAVTSYRAFLALANGKLPDEEFEARHRLVTLEHEH